MFTITHNFISKFRNSNWSLGFPQVNYRCSLVEWICRFCLRGNRRHQLGRRQVLSFCVWTLRNRCDFLRECRRKWGEPDIPKRSTWNRDLEWEDFWRGLSSRRKPIHSHKRISGHFHQRSYVLSTRLIGYRISHFRWRFLTNPDHWIYPTTERSRIASLIHRKDHQFGWNSVSTGSSINLWIGYVCIVHLLSAYRYTIWFHKWYIRQPTCLRLGRNALQEVTPQERGTISYSHVTRVVDFCHSSPHALSSAFLLWTFRA